MKEGPKSAAERTRLRLRLLFSLWLDLFFPSLSFSFMMKMRGEYKDEKNRDGMFT